MSKESPKRETVGIIGGGIVGLMSAYYLRKNYDVTIIEPEETITGTSVGNAGTICPNLLPWTVKNPWAMIKDNIVTRAKKGKSEVKSLFNFKLLLDSSFRSWAWKFIKIRSPMRTENDMFKMARLFYWSFNEFDSIAKEITGGHPEMIEFKEDKLVWVMTLETQKDKDLEAKWVG